MPMHSGFPQHWPQWLDRHIWPQIQTMMFHDCFFKLFSYARKLTRKSSGPIGWLMEVGYVTTQAAAIRRLCDPRKDVISLRRLLEELKSLVRLQSKSNFQESQIEKLSDKLRRCDYVCRMANNYIFHTADPRRRPNLSEWKLLVDHLTKAQKAICEVAVTLDRDLLKRRNYVEIIPVPQYNFTEEFESWAGTTNLQKLRDYFHRYRRAINAWIPRG